MLIFTRKHPSTKKPLNSEENKISWPINVSHFLCSTTILLSWTKGAIVTGMEATHSHSVRPELSLHRHHFLSRPTGKLILPGPLPGKERLIDTYSGYGCAFPTPLTLTTMTVRGLTECLRHWNEIAHNITGNQGTHFQQRCGCGLTTGRSTCHITFHAIWKLPARQSIGIA